MSEQMRGERLQIMLTEDELAALDDWRFSRRMPSRAAAVRELLRRGLTAEGMSLVSSRMKSKDYSVTDSASRQVAGNGHDKRGNGSADGADA